MATTLSGGPFVARSVAVGGVEHTYQVWLPRGYDSSKRWPAILFLHGAGERGNDGVKQTTVGLGAPLRDGSIDPPAIVIFPQCPDGEAWVGNARHIAIASLDATQREFAIDPQRISITGISLGGAGTWVVAAEQPDRFSGVAPVCGWVVKPSQLPVLDVLPTWLRSAKDSRDEVARRLAEVPVWILHGSDDPVIPVTASRAMAERLGANAAYTEFAHIGHNAWDPAYRTTGVVAWLVRQRRVDRGGRHHETDGSDEN